MTRLICLMLVGLVAYGDAALAINNGRYTIVSSLSGLTMDVAARSTADGARILQYTANGATNQQFDVVALGEGAYSITSVFSSKVVEVWQMSDVGQAMKALGIVS